MSTAPPRYAILTSGGDSPGMNAAIRAATMVLISEGAQVYGVESGYKGLCNGSFRELRPTDVANIIRDGGTVLGSARCKEFLTREGRDLARAQLIDKGIHGLVVIGGNGSLTGALRLTDDEERGACEVRVVGIPASIDNDIGLTGLCIGVDTAMNTIVEAIDKISDTASAHDRTFIVEVMGRSSGYLAMTASVAAGADAVLFPEAGKSEEETVDSVVRAVVNARTRERRSRRVIIVKAEGVTMSNDEIKERVDARLLAELGPDSPLIETRVTVLGHVVRGGRPSAFDRLLASRLANVAVRTLLSGQTRTMVGWMLPAAIPESVGVRSMDDPYCHVVDLEAALAETKHLLDGTSPLVVWRNRAFREIERVLAL